MNNKPLCIYHGNCADGFGAAWVVRKAAQEERLNIPDFHAGVYQTPPPDVTDRRVIMVDFSYKRPVLLEMAAKAASILIIDHHKTAAEDLVDLPKHVETVFDMNHSGAMLTWKYFFPNSKPPKLLEHIEDRDLWRFKLPYTREIQAAIFSHPYDFELWDGLMAMPSEVVRQFAKEGEAIERKHFKDIHEFIKVAQHFMAIGGVVVPVLNAPYFWSSDAGHFMAQEHMQGLLFAACYWDVPDGRVFSLRSTEVGMDVSRIAKMYGGGGHKNAAGFKVGTNHPLARREASETNGTVVPADLQSTPSRS